MFAASVTTPVGCTCSQTCPASCPVPVPRRHSLIPCYEPIPQPFPAGSRGSSPAYHSFVVHPRAGSPGTASADEQTARTLQAAAVHATYAPLLGTAELGSSSVTNSLQLPFDHASPSPDSLAQPVSHVASAGHGPFKPIVKTVGTDTNPTQSRYLKVFI